MKDCLKHVLKFIIRIGDAGASPPELEGAYYCSEDRVLWEGGALGNAVGNLATKGTAKEFHGCQERGFYRLAKGGQNGPIVGQFE